MVHQAGYRETRAILEKYSISLPKGILISSKSKVNLSRKIGYPQAMKIISNDVIHKSDAGGVVTGIMNIKEAKLAFKKIIKNVKRKMPDAEIKGVLVQKMSTGTEIIIGMKRDKQFGPVILFGLGGVFVEVLKDVTIQIAPVSINQAKSMIKRIKGISLLKGARGSKPADIDRIALIISRLSNLSMNEKDIIEIDLNPVMIDGNKINIVDARILKC